MPAPHRRFDQVCAPGYQGRKRGEVVRTRTVVLQAHTHQFLGTFGGPGNGEYRDEAAVQAAWRYDWSQGPVEGHVNRIKAIKRQMYGRAGFALLRRRLLSETASAA